MRGTTYSLALPKGWERVEPSAGAAFAAVAAYLCDKSHTFHTGDTVTVDGGYTVF